DEELESDSDDEELESDSDDEELESDSDDVSTEQADESGVELADGESDTPPAPTAHAGAGEPHDLGAISLEALRAMDAIKAESSRDRLVDKWQTLADCYRDDESPRGRNQKRIMAAVQQLAERTATITSRIGKKGESEDSLLAELEALWHRAVRLDELEFTPTLADAARFVDDWTRTRGDS
ncbi:MAG: DNA polymerase V family protein, partial [Proteobacteria bacterium]|nr:DNA polymerase V family protein [Pseudomonadota bacterium]